MSSGKKMKKKGPTVVYGVWEGKVPLRTLIPEEKRIPGGPERGAGGGKKKGGRGKTAPQKSYIWEAGRKGGGQRNS